MNALIVVFVGFLLRCIYSANFIPQIVDKINVEVVQEKNTGYLNCTMVLDESQLNQASWYYGGKQISIGGKLLEPIRIGLYGMPKYQAVFLPGRPDYAPTMPGTNVDQLRTYQLRVRFADINDNGLYRCVIEIKTLNRNLWPTAYGEMIVTQAPLILPGLASKIVDEGDSLTWVCRAQGSAQLRISWTRANGRPLSLPGSPQRIYTRTGVHRQRKQQQNKPPKQSSTPETKQAEN
nr:unnamed protein product [Spirometra erinaceieuropaei]